MSRSRCNRTRARNALFLGVRYRKDTLSNDKASRSRTAYVIAFIGFPEVRTAFFQLFPRGDIMHHQYFPSETFLVFHGMKSVECQPLQLCYLYKPKWSCLGAVVSGPDTTWQYSCGPALFYVTLTLLHCHQRHIDSSFPHFVLRITRT